MDEGPPGDRFEGDLRFGCGFLFGAAVLSLILGRSAFPSGSLWAIGLGGLLCGAIAARYGDRVYKWAGSILRWW
jgi:hypothetical protein